MNRLKETRCQRHLSRHQLAEAVGVHQNSIYWYETGRNAPSLANARRIAAVLNVTVDELFCTNECNEM